MKLSSGRWVLMVLMVMLAATGQHAAAQPTASEAIHLSFDAPTNCPSIDDFARQVKQRTSRAQLVTQAQPGVREFVVKIQPVGGAAGRGYVGTVIVDGTRSNELKAPMCATVVDGLALISALAIDPDALMQAPAGDDTGTDTDTGKATDKGKATDTGTRTDTVTITDTGKATDAGPDKVTATIADTGKGAGTAITIRTDAGLGVAFRIAPRVMPTVTIGVAAKLGRFTLRMSGTGGWRSTPVEATGYPNANASYRWLTARAQGCVDAVHRGQFELAGCVGFEAGSLNVAAHNIVNATASSRLWLAPQLGLRGQVRLGQSRWLALAQFAVSAPIIRDRYQFQPSLTVSTTAPYTVLVDFGAAMQF